MLRLLRVRPAVSSDAIAWETLRRELWPDGAENHGSEIASFFSGQLAEPMEVLLAVDAADEAIGFVELSIRNDVPGLEGKRTGFVEGLYVIPSMRFCGVAHSLLIASRGWAKSMNCVAFASDRSDRFIIDRRFRGISFFKSASQK